MAALPINAVKGGQTGVPSAALPASLFYHIQPGGAVLPVGSMSSSTTPAFTSTTTAVSSATAVINVKTVNATTTAATSASQPAAFQVNLSGGYSLSPHPQQHLAAALAAAQQQPPRPPLSVSLANAHASSSVALSGLTGQTHQLHSSSQHEPQKPSQPQQHITQTVFLSPPPSGSPSGAPNLALNLASNNPSVPITAAGPASIPSISGLPMMAVKLNPSSTPHLAASIGVKRQSSSFALAAPADFRSDPTINAENGSMEKSRRIEIESADRRTSAATTD